MKDKAEFSSLPLEHNNTGGSDKPPASTKIFRRFYNCVTPGMAVDRRCRRRAGKGVRFAICFFKDKQKEVFA